MAVLVIRTRYAPRTTRLVSYGTTSTVLSIAELRFFARYFFITTRDDSTTYSDRPSPTCRHSCAC